VLVTADEIPDPYDRQHRRDALAVRADDRPRFPLETLRPAEVFGSGTVGGGSAAEVGRTLHAGDVVELTVDRLGTLRNTVGAAPNG
jgi:hypothetical protein